MTRICTICARGGSKGVINKNIRILNGKPLIAHSIDQAKRSELFDVIAVSSDSREILEISKQYGADLIIERPLELATDHAAKLPVIQHCVESAENMSGLSFDTFVDLDATSPLRTVEDIVNSVKEFEMNSEACNLVTGMRSRRSPYFNLVEKNSEGYVNLSKQLKENIVRRQDSPECFDLNASIYIWNRTSLFNSQSVFNDFTMLFEMPEDRSIDIDSELDFEFVQFIANKRGDLS
jgi:CMP-N,N'-diacetyllegionaminic acid synthase